MCKKLQEEIKRRSTRLVNLVKVEDGHDATVTLVKGTDESQLQALAVVDPNDDATDVVYPITAEMNANIRLSHVTIATKWVI